MSFIILSAQGSICLPNILKENVLGTWGTAIALQPDYGLIIRFKEVPSSIPALPWKSSPRSEKGMDRSHSLVNYRS